MKKECNFIGVETTKSKRWCLTHDKFESYIKPMIKHNLIEELDMGDRLDLFKVADKINEIIKFLNN